jgi:hypothetical protein
MTHRNPTDMLRDTLANRTGVGPSDLVKGWQSLLGGVLARMQPYLKTGKLVTFQRLASEEKMLFERMVDIIDIHESVQGLYLPPSVRNQMMYTNRGEPVPEEAMRPADDGVLLFALPAENETIVNALLAHPPHTPAIDVYQEGTMIAGYMYERTEEMLSEIGQVVKTHLVRPRLN